MAYQAETVDTSIGRRESLGFDRASRSRMVATCTLRITRRLVKMLTAVVAVLLISIGNTATQTKADEVAVQPKKILFLNSFGPNFQPWATWSREIDRELNRQSPWPLDIQQQSLITARGDDERSEVKLAEYLGVLYDPRPPDLIVAIGAPAARFVQRHRASLFPATPMLLAAVEERLVNHSLLAEKDVVAAARVDVVALFKNILQLLPETKAIAIIAGNSPNERFWASEQRRLLGPLLANRVELIFYNERPFGTILKEVSSLPPHSAIFYQQLAVDGAGAVYGDKDPLKRIYEVTNAPIFSFDETFFNGEIVGGPMWSPSEGARPTAAVAVRMLGGETASGITVPPIEFSLPKFDWRQLQRWNISENRLPTGSKVYFREPDIWQRYPLQIALIVAVVLAQGALIQGLLRERRRRQFAEVQSRQRMAELARVMRFSTAGELTASIAHEMNQPLGSILTNAETAQAILKSPSPDISELNEIVSDIVRDDQRASEIIRRIKSLLKKAPFELKSLDFNDVARETVEFLATTAIARKFQLTSLITQNALPILGDPIQLQQVILNIVVNGIDAMKDTPVENRIISIRTSRVEKFAQLSVSDRGPGIPEDKLNQVFEPFYTSKAEGMGMGLSIARTIIEAHNGMICAKNRDDGGTTFTIRLALADRS
jgi:signal transduction histidine kinase